jgi:hypothetical protein
MYPRRCAGSSLRRCPLRCYWKLPTQWRRAATSFRLFLMNFSRTSSSSRVDCTSLVCSNYNSMSTCCCWNYAESDDLMWWGLVRTYFKLCYWILFSTVLGLLSLDVNGMLYPVILLPKIVKGVVSFVLYAILNCHDLESRAFPYVRIQLWGCQSVILHPIFASKQFFYG